MSTIRTAHLTRTKLAVTTVAALAGLTLAITACGSSGANADGSPGTASAAGKGVSGIYLATEAHNGNLVIIDGSKITYVSLHASPKNKCALLTRALKDIDSGKLAPSDNHDEDRYEIESTGTINENQTMVLWDDDNGRFTGKKAGSGSIKIEPGMITLEHILDPHAKADVLVPRDSDQGKAVKDKYCR